MVRHILAAGAGAVAILLFTPAAHAQIEPSIAPAPPRTTPDPVNAGPFPVGLWMKSAGGCKGNGTPMRLHKDHSYERETDAGSWRIAGGQIQFSYRDTSRWGDAPVSAQMEAASPIVTKRVTIARLAPDRMTLAGVTWTRCSTDPDLYQLP